MSTFGVLRAVRTIASGVSPNATQLGAISSTTEPPVLQESPSTTILAVAPGDWAAWPIEGSPNINGIWFFGVGVTSGTPIGTLVEVEIWADSGTGPTLVLASGVISSTGQFAASLISSGGPLPGNPTDAWLLHRNATAAPLDLFVVGNF